MAETLEAGGQDMQQEAPDEFDGIEGHEPLAVAMGIVFPPKGHPPLLQRQQAPIRDRHTMRITREILQHRPRATSGGLGIYDPLHGPEGVQELLPPRVPVRGWQRPSNVRAPAVYACWSPVRNRRRNTRLRTRTGRKKVGRQARHCVPIGGQPAPGNDTVEVGMMVQRLAPGMQHREEADLRPQMVRIACHGQEGLGHGLKEERIQHPRVLEREWAEGMREGKHHMDVGDVEQLRFAGREPGRLRAGLDTWGNADCDRSYR